MAYDEGLAERLRERLAGTPGLGEKHMFGGLAFLVWGNMCVGVLGDGIVARVGPDAAGEALAEPGARVFDFTGRPMKGWVSVAPDALAEDGDLDRWLGRCLTFVATQPPK